VTIDGVDVRDLTLQELRTHVGMAFEDSTLFSQTVRENVLLGREDLAPGSAQAEAVLREALAVAQAGFVDELPDGVDTIIGEEGLARAASASASRWPARRGAPRRARARRPAVGARRRHRGARRGRPARGDGRHDDPRHRAPTLDGHPRRPGGAARRGRITAVGTHTELLRTSEHYRHVISSLEDAEAQENTRLRETEVNL
jgi:ATP-binding cassette subfamily B protein